MVITFEGKNHQWIAKFVGKSITKNRVLAYHQNVFKIYLIITKRKTNSIVEKHGERHLSEVFC